MFKEGKFGQIGDEKTNPYEFLFVRGVVECLLFLATIGPARYSQIRKQGCVSGDRSLSKLLKQLQAHGLVKREVLSTYPISTQYALTEKGKVVVKHLKDLLGVL